MLTGTWESLAFLLGSVAEKTVQTRTKVPIISAPNPVPLLYPSASSLAPPPYLVQSDFWNAFTNPTPQIAPKHCATMYNTARISDTFLAKNSPNVTAGFMCPPAYPNFNIYQLSLKFLYPATIKTHTCQGGKKKFVYVCEKIIRFFFLHAWYFLFLHEFNYQNSLLRDRTD